MNRSLKVTVASAVLAVGCMIGSAAHAQATRTWVSGVGDDANPCSRTAPCKTFAGAISKTAASGEINCLDPGGFGGVTITKSITIMCEDVVGGVLVTGGISGIVINDGSTGTPGTIRVILRGLDINGAGTGGIGINFLSGASLVVEDTIIYGFNGGSAVGLRFATSRPAQLHMDDVILTNNGTAAAGGGIVIQPTGTGTARVSMRNVNSSGNLNTGLVIDATSTTGAAGLQVSVDDSQFSGNTNGILSNGTGTFITAMISRSSITNNSAAGVVANGFSSTMVVGGSTITGNATGVSAPAGSVIHSYGNNQLDGNPNYAAPNNGTFSPPTQTPR